MRTSLRDVAGLALVLGANFAAAESSPYYVGANLSAVHDSNVFRTADAPISDTTVAAGVVAGFDQRIGRQRIFANGSVNANVHQRLGYLNDTSYDLISGVDWATLHQLTGTLRYSTHSGLADYGVANAPVTIQKNLLRTQQLFASGRLPLDSRIALETNVEYRSVGYSALAYRSLAYSQWVAGAGLRYSPGRMLKFGLGARQTWGETPEFEVSPGVFEPDRLRRGDIDFSVTLAGSRSSLTARVSFSHESHSQPSYPAFSGLTGAIDVDYAPAAKWRIAAQASRDTGAATTFLLVGPSEGIDVDTNRISTQWRASVSYAATAKIRLSALARHNRGESASILGTVTDRTQSYAVQADWDPRPAFRLSCSVAHESRAGAFDSRATVSGCSATAKIH